MVPLSLQKGAAFCKLSFNATFPSYPFYRKTFLIHSLTSYLSFMHSREPQACRPEFLRNLPTYEPWLIPTCESSDSHRQQTKFAALRSALKLENRYYICNFLSSFQKGALPCNLLPTCESSDSHRQQTKFAALRSALKLENRYYICNFLSSFQKGALPCNLST